VTQAVQPYQEPPSQLPVPPTEFNLGGHRYVLVTASETQQAPAPYQHQGPIINGVPHVPGPHGYQPYQAPYHAHPANPPWLRNHYTRGTGILIAAGCIGAVLFIVAAALFTLVTWALANLMAIAVTVIIVFFGGLVLLGKLASARHGHPIRR